MLGYLNRPQETADTLDADGFLRTGDIATVRADGVVTIVDRLKELIKYNGYQIAPAELEALLLTHPGIADSAVVGSLDADGQEVPKAFVVRQPGRGRRCLGRGGRHGLRGGQGGAVQEGPPGRVHRGRAEVRLRKNPAADA